MRLQRLKRSRTGCQDCRKRRVRCPEGKYLIEGGREECLNCKRGGVECFYPLERPGERKQIWISAKDCRFPSPKQKQQSQPSSIESEPDQNLSNYSNSPVESMILWIDSIPYDLNLDLPTFTGINCCDMESFLLCNEDDCHQSDKDQIERQTEEMNSTVDDIQSIEVSNQVPLWQRRNIRNLFSPSLSILPPLSEPGITQMTDDQLDIFAVRTFEKEGCKEIVSVGHQNQNWIHSLLLPKITNLFSHYGIQEISSEFYNPSLALKRYGFHSLMQLSYVHQANTQKDYKVAIESSSRALKHRSLAYTAAFQLRVRHPTSSWQVEEYFMSFFITCMADMLSSHTFQVDEKLIFTLPNTSPFSKSLKGLLGVYKNLSEICKPPDPVSTSKIELEKISFDIFEEIDSDPWVENFFGFSLSMIECFQNINKLVSYRTQLLLSNEKDIQEGEERIKFILENLIGNLDQINDWRICSWVKSLECKPRRVQRGTMVMGRAITMIIYSELLQADLVENQQLQQLRQSAIELVADTCIQELAGYHLMLAIIAIYTPDLNQRDTYLETLNMAQRHSFGHGHKGLRDVVCQCWKMYDETGKYMNGIAPWREMMAASGVSMCI